MVAVYHMSQLVELEIQISIYQFKQGHEPENRLSQIDRRSRQRLNKIPMNQLLYTYTHGDRTTNEIQQVFEAPYLFLRVKPAPVHASNA